MDLQRIQVGPVTVDLFAQEDRIVAHIREKKKGFEPDSLTAWAKMCVRGKTALDIGGYSGLFAIAAAKLGCKAWAVEPMPKNMQRLRDNALLNKVKIETVEAIASDFDGPGEITYNSKVVGLTAGASTVRKKGFRWPVVAVTIDGLKLDDVCAIKIDVERGEPSVLRGARETIERCRPMMLVEALGESERALVLAEMPNYRVDAVLDVRNLLMVHGEPVR